MNCSFTSFNPIELKTLFSILMFGITISLAIASLFAAERFVLISKDRASFRFRPDKLYLRAALIMLIGFIPFFISVFVKFRFM